MVSFSLMLTCFYMYGVQRWHSHIKGMLDLLVLEVEVF
jgi:hypothetical protein